MDGESLQRSGGGAWKAARRTWAFPKSSAYSTRGKIWRTRAVAGTNPQPQTRAAHFTPGREVYDGEAVRGLLGEKWFDQH